MRGGVYLDNQKERIKRTLGIEDHMQDLLLEDILDDAESHFKWRFGVESIDEKYNFIIRDVAVKRYQRKGSEAMNSESMDGWSVSYKDGASDFDEYAPIIEQELGLSDSRRGKVKFL